MMEGQVNLGPQSKRWSCHVCGLHLSSKQRLQTHISSKHPSAVLPDNLRTDRGLYKAYELDHSLPVPKRTKIRHQSAADHTSRNPTVETVPQLSEELYEHSNVLSEHNISHTIEFDKTINAESSQEKCMAVLTYMSKMRLTGTASDQLIRLLNICGNLDLSKDEISNS
ncbi:hypothetical protein DPMN_019015 [Dreissena polymorpha]|uniref:C2H2-type domain-containing protein n=1 Tax=Dreissena polymorpha TaxID=45954 RepID=A0A9D4S7T5_DREPO|nr:hypothetical protein DPMN_019015 [Dreissena polymorpha]